MKPAHITHSQWTRAHTSHTVNGTTARKQRRTSSSAVGAKRSNSSWMAAERPAKAVGSLSLRIILACCWMNLRGSSDTVKLAVCGEKGPLGVYIKDKTSHSDACCAQLWYGKGNGAAPCKRVRGKRGQQAFHDIQLQPNDHALCKQRGCVQEADVLQQWEGTCMVDATRENDLQGLQTHLRVGALYVCQR